MDDSVNFLVVENFLYAFAVQHIGFVEGYFLSGNLFYTLDGFLACIVKVVHDNNVIACVQQFHPPVTKIFILVSSMFSFAAAFLPQRVN